MMLAYDTRDTKGKIQVMQSASMGGKPVQYSTGNGQWHDCVREPVWNWGQFDYRIKPSPGEWCLYVNAAGCPCWVPWTEAHRGQGIHVREVVG